MSNKYYAYSIVAIKSLLSASSSGMGLVMNAIIGLIGVAFLTIFDIELIPMIEGMSTGGASDQMGNIKIVSIVAMTLLMSTVSAIMQSVMSDRDNKISEIISTSIYEKHYIFGKIAAAVALAATMVINTIVALILSLAVYSMVNSIPLSKMVGLLTGMFSGMSGNDLFLSILLMFLTITTSILCALILSIKVNNMHEAGPTVLVILLPYIFMIGLFFFMPTEVETWKNISQVLMFVPILSPFFSIINLSLYGLDIYNTVSILLSFAYVWMFYAIAVKIYKVAFYNNIKYRYIDLVKIINEKRAKYVGN